MVNIQSSTEFGSQILNRDVWKDKVVTDLVRRRFLFLQVQQESREGLRLLRLYPQDTLPAVFIVNGRTGEAMSSIRVPPACSKGCDPADIRKQRTASFDFFFVSFLILVPNLRLFW